MKSYIDKTFCPFDDEQKTIIFRRADTNSANWYYRILLPSGKHLVKSAKTRHKEKAMKIAEERFFDIRTQQKEHSFKKPNQISLKVPRGSIKRPCGLYEIRNRQTETVYVGYSTNITDRWRKHRGALVRDKHKNKKLQKEWNLWGHWCFEWKVVEMYPSNTCIEFLKEIEEQKIIKNIKTGKKIYNSLKRG